MCEDFKIKIFYLVKSKNIAGGVLPSLDGIMCFFDGFLVDFLVGYLLNLAAPHQTSLGEHQTLEDEFHSPRFFPNLLLSSL